MITGGYIQYGNIIIPFNVIEYYVKAKCYIQDDKIYTKAYNKEIDLNWLLDELENQQF